MNEAALIAWKESWHRFEMKKLNNELTYLIEEEHNASNRILNDMDEVKNQFVLYKSFI